MNTGGRQSYYIPDMPGVRNGLLPANITGLTARKIKDIQKTASSTLYPGDQIDTIGGRSYVVGVKGQIFEVPPGSLDNGDEP